MNVTFDKLKVSRIEEQFNTLRKYNSFTYFVSI
jgi:hypothetical protein